MNRSLYTSKITGGVLKKIDQQIQKVGLAKTMRLILKNTKTKLKIIKEDKSVDEVLKNEPTIVICNHPAEAEVLVLLSSIPKRKNVNLVANHSFLKILPSIDKYIIPVYIVHRITAGHFNLKYRILRKIHQADSYCKEESHQKNIASINLASAKVSQGGLVIIFPAAGEENGHFLPGLGYIIKHLTNRNKAKLVMAHVAGTSNLDYLRMIPLLNRLMPKIELNFARPINIDKYKGTDAREITKQVEVDFYDWSGKFETKRESLIPGTVNAWQG